MHCDQAGEMMSARLDNCLDRTQITLLEGHLARCSACRAEWHRLQALDRLLASAPKMHAPVRLRVQVMDRIHRREQARRAIIGGTALALGTVALSLLLLAPACLGLLNATGIAPALVSGGPETAVQLLATLGATGRAVLVLIEKFATPLALLSLCGLVTTLALNGLWVSAVRRVRAGNIL